MKRIILGLLIVVLLLSGCSSYKDCKYDCLDFCMEGKEYKSIWEMERSESITIWNRAAPECKTQCYKECKPTTEDEE